MSTKIQSTAPQLDFANKTIQNTCSRNLNIRFTDYSTDSLVATMPVNENTMNPVGILHGGASVLLAETVGGVTSMIRLRENAQTVVGVSINANYLRPAYKGSIVTATSTPIKLGRKLHVWDIKIRDEKDRMVCICRLTMAVVDV